MSLFPHQKLEWSLRRLEQQLDADPEDLPARMQFATALWSHAAFHGGDESVLDDALTQARTVLQQRDDDPGVLVLVALCLIGLDRRDEARTHLDHAASLDTERADLHYALSMWHQAGAERTANGEPRTTRAALDAALEACRIAPEAWEPHALLAQLLWAQVQERGGPARAAGASDRPLQRSMYHAVRALELAPPPKEAPQLLYHLGITCLHTGRFEDANRVLSRLLQEPVLRARAEYYLGLVHYQMGHYKHAILYLRKHLQHTTEAARVHARIGMAHLRLGELAKAREACQQAIALEPSDLQSRWTLGCALLEDGRQADALRTFKEILADAPDHTPAFRELVRAHAHRGEVPWLHDALRSEVSAFDRVGVGGRTATGVSPRQATRERITALIDAMLQVSGVAAATPLLEALDATVDEGLRMLLWDGALAALQTERAAAVHDMLDDAGKRFSAEAGRQVLALATSVDAELLLGGLQIDEEDLRRAAVDRHGPTGDVTELRRAIDLERRQARAWQALLLLAVASQGRAAHKPLLVRWAAEADADLGDAARAALVMLGDAGATEVLRKRAHAFSAQNLVDAMVSQVRAPEIRTPVRAAGPEEARVCATCARHTEDVEVMLIGGTLSMCSVCLDKVAREREKRRLDDPDRVCDLSGRGASESAEMYLFNGVAVCAEVVDHALSRIEQAAVDRFLRAQP